MNDPKVHALVPHKGNGVDQPTESNLEKVQITIVWDRKTNQFLIDAPLNDEEEKKSFKKFYFSTGLL